MRSAMTMIELIFAIVIIAISVMSIPSMMSVANNASKGIIIDEDVMSRLSGWALDKFQARWDGNYSASGSGPLWISGSADLNCSRGSGNVWYRDNNDSTVQCNDQNLSPAVIQSVYPDGNVSLGIERLNGGSEPISINLANGISYDVNATYRVAYVDSNVSTTGNTAKAIWILGSSGNMNPTSPSGNDGTTISHLKRVVTRFDSSDVNITLSFFKSNKGN